MILVEIMGMDWYKRAQTDDEDILGDIVREHLSNENKDPFGNPLKPSLVAVPPVPGVKRYFTKSPSASFRELASIESMIMLEPIDGIISNSSIINAKEAVWKDSDLVKEKLKGMGYEIMPSPAEVINVYGKKKVVTQFRVLCPEKDSNRDLWWHKFWVEDSSLTGAVVKPKSWGKK